MGSGRPVYVVTELAFSPATVVGLLQRYFSYGGVGDDSGMGISVRWVAAVRVDSGKLESLSL